MKFKASLHLHTSEDSLEGYMIKYNIYDLIDKAAECGFKILGLTCHKRVIFDEKYREYARARGILLIFGVELRMYSDYVWGKDVIILNITPEIVDEAERINSFEELENFKNKNKNIFVLAVHPVHSLYSMGKNSLVNNISIFDAVEHSWFYNSIINPNIKAKKICDEFKKPFISTADLHVLSFFDKNYVILEAEKLDEASIFSAIKNGKFTNVTAPSSLITLGFHFSGLMAKKIIYGLFKNRQSHAPNGA